MYVGTPLGRVIALDAGHRTRALGVRSANRPRRHVRRLRQPRRVDVARRVGACRRAVPPADFRRHRAIAADCYRRTQRPTSARDSARRASSISQAGLRIAALRAAGLFDDVAAGRRERPRHHRFVDRRQQPAATSASGEVRAYDARTGALKWTWDPIPQDPQRSGVRRVARRDGATRAAAPTRGRCWPAIRSADLVFVPTGSAAPDYYGALRLGDNRYANSIVALRASTGRVVWAFQTVHHDLWDYDNASPPALVTLTRRRRARCRPWSRRTRTACCSCSIARPARRSFPSRSGRCRRATFRSSRPSPTQPFTAVTPPLSPHRFTADDVWGCHDADRAACRAA